MGNVSIGSAGAAHLQSFELALAVAWMQPLQTTRSGGGRLNNILFLSSVGGKWVLKGKKTGKRTRSQASPKRWPFSRTSSAVARVAATYSINCTRGWQLARWSAFSKRNCAATLVMNATPVVGWRKRTRQKYTVSHRECGQFRPYVHKNSR